MATATPTAPTSTTVPGRWNALLRLLEYVAYPAAAGAAFTLLALGVVTWLPALAAVGGALQRWRTTGDSRCFTGVLTAFPRYWRALWRYSCAGAAASVLLAANAWYLLHVASPLSMVLLAAQAGIAAALVILAVAVAAQAGRAPEAGARAWLRDGFALGFGSPARGTALLGAAVSAVLVSLVVPLGPLLLGPSVPVLLALSFADPRRNTA
ncbi:hypothetical protein [Streptomyces hydrogenans]|uniref:hypothetical protein n=1 Tax=Streptomyces hydrogenans TaxID=1873719 RepID=UPI0035D89622